MISFSNNQRKTNFFSESFIFLNANMHNLKSVLEMKAWMSFNIVDYCALQIEQPYELECIWEYFGSL